MNPIMGTTSDMAATHNPNHDGYSDNANTYTGSIMKKTATHPAVAKPMKPSLFHILMKSPLFKQVVFPTGKFKDLYRYV